MLQRQDQINPTTAISMEQQGKAACMRKLLYRQRLWHDAFIGFRLRKKCPWKYSKETQYDGTLVQGRK